MLLVGVELFCIIYVVELEAVHPSLNHLAIRTLVRLMDLRVVLSGYSEARSFPPPSSFVKMKGLEVMDLLPPSVVVVVSMGVALLFLMLPVRLVLISSREEGKTQDRH